MYIGLSNFLIEFQIARYISIRRIILKQIFDIRLNNFETKYVSPT